jgi:hypothetical protein
MMQIHKFGKHDDNKFYGNLFFFRVKVNVNFYNLAWRVKIYQKFSFSSLDKHGTSKGFTYILYFYSNTK